MFAKSTSRGQGGAKKRARRDQQTECKESESVLGGRWGQACHIICFAAAQKTSRTGLEQDLSSDMFGPLYI